MTEEEVNQIFKVLAAEYGKKVAWNKERSAIWQYVLGHATFNEVKLAVVQLLAENRPFPPTIGEVNQTVLKLRKGVQIDWGSLWDEVMRAAQRSTYYATEEAAKLNPDACAAIGGPAGLRELAACSAEMIPTIRAQFRQRLEARHVNQQFEETRVRNEFLLEDKQQKQKRIDK